MNTTAGVIMLAPLVFALTSFSFYSVTAANGSGTEQSSITASNALQNKPDIALEPKKLDVAQPIDSQSITTVQEKTISTTQSSSSNETTQEPDAKADKTIFLNFENAELINFIEYIAELKKLNIIPDKTLEGSKVSLTIREPLSVEGAWNIFLTVLEMAGFSIIQTGEVHKVIPKDKKLTQPLPAYINIPYQMLPDSDLTIRYVLFLTNIRPSEVEQILSSMLSDKSSLHTQNDMNAFIITDKSFNIKAAAKLITELDQMGLPETVTVLRLKEVNAKDTKDLLDGLINKKTDSPLARLLGKASEGGTEYFSPTTRIIAEERSNSLILLGNNKSIDKIIEFIKKNIDTEIKSADTPLHIYELQHIDAAQVASILKEVTAIPDSATGQVAGKYGSIRGGVKYFKGMTFQVDKDGNRLIVSCVDKQDWKLLKQTIQDLDKPQPQVAIESLLVTITSNDRKEIGGSMRLKKHGQIGKNIDFQSAGLQPSPTLERSSDDTPISLLGNMLNQLVATQGQTVLTFGPATNIWGVFKVLKTQTNASILSQPFVTIANKTPAHIDVGGTKRVISNTAGTGSDQVTGFVEVEAATKLDITPQINIDGVIRLKIKVEISEFEDADGNSKSTRVLDTTVSVADGQVLVLGGFVKTKVSEGGAKTPILGDIPFIGWLFKNQSRVIDKQYIFIFISPTILKPRQAPGMNLYTKMKLHQATDDIEEAVQTKRTIDPIHNWFFNPEKENYSHKVIDFANARYQPTTVDIKNDIYYHAQINHSDSEVTLNREVMTSTTENKEIESSTVEEKTATVTEKTVPQETTTIKASPEAPQQAITAIKIDDQKRDIFKKALIEPPLKPIFMQQEQFKEPQLVIDPNKRNKLKDFLSANASAKNQNSQTSAQAGRI